MTNKDYLEAVLSMFGKNRKDLVIKMAYANDKILDTTILAYSLYTYNFLPYCVATSVSGDVLSVFYANLNVESFDDNVIDINNISISKECAIFVDKLINFRANPYFNKINKDKKLKKDKQEITISYMVYMLITNKEFVSYDLFQSCLSTRDYNYIKTTLYEDLLVAYNIPNNQTLIKYGRFLTNPLDSNVDKCVGRDKELSDIIDILCRKKKNNVVLVGQPGVGKTAIVEGFANLLMSSKCPKKFVGYHLYELSISSMIAGSKYRGDFEEKMEGVLKSILELQQPIIIFIDEIHNIMVSHGSSENSSLGMSAADILKPYLGRSDLLLIGATTEAEYKIIEKDSAMGRRFSPIHIKEPTNVAVCKLLENVLDEYSKHFDIDINTSIVPEIVKYAEIYIPNRYMPDKALDLLDESCVYCSNHGNGKELNLSDIVHATETLTGIKIPTQKDKSISKINYIIDTLKSNIIGQDEAIKEVESVVKRYFLGLCNKQKPLGSFLFVGPTGVGKTQLCKELAHTMFTKESFIRFDMSEFMEKHSVAKFIGAPPGYVGYGSGGQLTEAVKNNPYSVILLDEIEKAHPDIFNILLQILDDGQLTDGEGLTISFINCIIVLTSNVGSSDVSEKLNSAIGFGSSNTLSNKEISHIYEKAVKQHFKPEFINRLNKVVYFNSLTYDNIKEIVDKELNLIHDKFLNNNIELNISKKALTQLYDKCYSKEYGARFAQRLITTDIEDLVIDFIISENILTEDKIKLSITTKDGKFSCKQLQAVTA